jgi:glycosidase
MRRALAGWLLLATSCGPAPAPDAPTTRRPSASAEWWNGAVVYQVFVRSFRDSGGDGAGDLRGLLEKLDYLNDGDPATDGDLGVDAIWLMPIFASPSDHGYDVADYEQVNPDYGTLSDFDALVAAAHARGIKVILDFVPNHTASTHPWFLESASASGSPRRAWYVWNPVDPGWRQPWSRDPAWHPAATGFYYGLFWSGMPDLNWREAAVRAEMSAAALRWLARGADGFRLDAVRYLVEDGPGLQQDRPGTHAALKELAAAVRATRPGAMMVGEAWADASTIASYFGATEVEASGDELPLLFDFPLAEAVLGGVSSGRAAVVADALDAVARVYPPGVGDAPFLSNHDQVRVATRLGGDAAGLRLAATILLTLQGTPFVYYGEEIGMRNGACSADECKRTPMAWDGTAAGGFTSGSPWWPLSPGKEAANVASQAGDPSSLLSRYRRLIRLRQGSPALGRGGTERLVTGNPAVLAYLRDGAGETVLVAHNLGTSGAAATLAAPGAAATALLADPGASLAPAGAGWTVSLPPRASGVWRLQ